MAEMEFAPRTPAFYVKRTVGFILILALAAVFFYSAGTKLYAIEAFEWTFVDIGIRNYTLATILARLLIGIEFAIGAFLLFHIRLKKLTYPITILTLVIFTIYLIILMTVQGNEGDCGCFGESLKMTPLQGIIKNVVMLVVTLLLMAIHSIKPQKWQLVVGTILLMASLVVPFVIYPMNIGNMPQKADKVIDLDPLYENDIVPEVDLRKGKHIISYMSLTCPHCKKAARFLNILKKRYPEYSIHFVLSGHEDHKKAFFEASGADRVPYIILKNKAAFIDMAGTSVPAILWVNDGMVEYKGNYLQLDPAVIEDWLKQ